VWSDPVMKRFYHAGGADSHCKRLFRISGAAKSGRFVSDCRVAVDAGKDTDGGGFILPTGPPQYASRAGVWPLGVFLGAFLVIVGIVPVVDPFPDVARHVIDSIGTLPGFVAADRHQGLFPDPL